MNRNYYMPPERYTDAFRRRLESREQVVFDPAYDMATDSLDDIYVNAYNAAPKRELDYARQYGISTASAPLYYGGYQQLPYLSQLHSGLGQVAENATQSAAVGANAASDGLGGIGSLLTSVLSGGTSAIGSVLSGLLGSFGSFFGGKPSNTGTTNTGGGALSGLLNNLLGGL